MGADGSFSYVPAPNYFGADSFTYVASDGFLSSGAVTVSIEVTSVNDAPLARPDRLNVPKNGSATVDALANDTDVDGDTLTVIAFTQGSSGEVKYSQKNDNFRYTPRKGFTGTDTFTYTISDGNGGTATTVVTVVVG